MSTRGLGDTDNCKRQTLIDILDDDFLLNIFYHHKPVLLEEGWKVILGISTTNSLKVGDGSTT